MKKENTIGVVGENIFINFLKENNIPFTDLRNYQRVQTINVNERDGCRGYIYLGKLHTHPFDFIVGNLNIEIKTSTIHMFDNKIIFSWTKNDKKNIDYVIGLVVNKENKLLNFLLFNNDYINSHNAFSAKYSEELSQIIAKKDIIKLLTV